MPKLVSHVIGLIEIDAPAQPTDLVETPDLVPMPTAAEADPLRARILRFDAGMEQTPAPRILRLDRAKNERRRCDLNRLCQELEAELVRVRRLMATIKRMSRE
jgi:hypothetical protein